MTAAQGELRDFATMREARDETTATEYGIVWRDGKFTGPYVTRDDAFRTLHDEGCAEYRPGLIVERDVTYSPWSSS